MVGHSPHIHVGASFVKLEISISRHWQIDPCRLSNGVLHSSQDL